MKLRSEAAPATHGRTSGRGKSDHRQGGTDLVICLHCRREYRTVRWSHLVSAHGYDPEHPVVEYKARFGLRRAISIGTLLKMKRSIRAHFEKQGRGWTRARVRTEILQRRGRGSSLRWTVMHRRYPELAWAAGRLFGSWEKAVRACGVSYDSVRAHRAWTPRGMIDAIVGLKRSGAGLNAGAMRRRDYGLLQSAVARWGTWARALQAAGIDPGEASVLRRWNRATVLDAVRGLGRLPQLREMKKRDSGLLDAASRIFGSWKAAVEAAGLAYLGRNAPRKWPREIVLEEVRRRARLGFSVRATEIQRNSRGLGAAGRREFGTWPRAVEAAGVPYPKRHGGWKWPRERIVREIRARVRRKLSVRDRVVKRELGGLWWAGYREFGTWRSAVVAAGRRYPGPGER